MAAFCQYFGLIPLLLWFIPLNHNFDCCYYDSSLSYFSHPILLHISFGHYILDYNCCSFINRHFNNFIVEDQNIVLRNFHINFDFNHLSRLDIFNFLLHQIKATTMLLIIVAIITIFITMVFISTVINFQLWKSMLQLYFLFPYFELFNQ